MAPTVLIAEDDQDIASTLARGLSADGYDTRIAHNAEAARAASSDPLDAAIVDMMLGADRGVDVIRDLRGRGMDGPILILSALSAVEDRTDGLEAGADDYIAKPFEYSELLTRLRVQERRRSRDDNKGPVALLGRLHYDDTFRTVTNGERTVALTEREADLLKLLASHANRLQTRGEIFDALWLNDGSSSENVVDVYIGYLRRKLAPIDDFGVALRTIRGRGFILIED